MPYVYVSVQTNIEWSNLGENSIMTMMMMVLHWLRTARCVHIPLFCVRERLILFGTH